MARVFRLSLVLLGVFFYAACSQPILRIQEEKISNIHNILDAHNSPSAPLLQLLKITNIQHNGTLEDIVQATQKAWLRPAGKERWEMTETFADKRSIILPILSTLGLILS